MSIKISKTDKNFEFSKITLGDPQSLGNNMFFSKIKNGEDIYIQTPEIKSKEGVVLKPRGSYIDIIFDNTHEEILEWFENLENSLKDIIFEEKKDEWFQDSNIDYVDIENIFNSPIKSIRSGKSFILRTHLDSAKSMINKKKIIIYDEDENILNESSLKSESKFIAILHVNGLKFSSKNFQIYIDVKEIMILNDKKVIEKNISKNVKKEIVNNDINNTVKLIEDDNKIIHEETNNNEENINKNDMSDVKDEKVNNLENVENEEIKKSDFSNIKQENKKDEEDKLEPIISDTNDLSEQLIKVNTELKDTELNNTNLNEVKENNYIKEFNILDTLDESNSIKINDPTNEQYETYKTAVLEAKEARQKAMEAYMNAKNIKAQYLFNLELESESDEDCDLEEV